MKKTIIMISAAVLAAGTALAGPEQLFKKWDTDKDGKISKEEFTEMTRAQFAGKGKEGYAEEAAKRFQKRDADGDGILTLEEFVSTPGAK